MEIGTCLLAGIDPVLLPLTYNPTSATGSGSSRGIAVKIGNPNQFFSMRPTVDIDNSFVTNVVFCGTKDNSSCVARFGGVYTPSDNAISTDSVAAWNGTPSLDSDYASTYFNDRFTIDDREILGAPFFAYENKETNPSWPSSLALGTHSSLLRAAFEVEMIGTKMWSIWPGNLDQNLDGLLILGGYDEDRVAGEFTKMPVGEYSALNIEITGIEWKSSAGDSTNLMPNGTTRLSGILDLSLDYIVIPFNSSSAFIEATNATYNSSTNAKYIYEHRPQGSLIVTLSNGVKTTIPPEDLFRFPEIYDNRGRLQIETFNYYEPKILYPSIYSSPNFLLRFGHPFLTQKLLVADFDNSQYFMANAVKYDLGPGAKNLKPLCTGGPTMKDSTTKDDNTGANAEDNDSGNSKKSNTAAIAGGVTGGIGGALLLGLLASFLILRCKKAQTQTDEQPGPRYPKGSRHTGGDGADLSMDADRG